MTALTSESPPSVSDPFSLSLSLTMCVSGLVLLISFPSPFRLFMLQSVCCMNITLSSQSITLHVKRQQPIPSDTNTNLLLPQPMQQLSSGCRHHWLSSNWSKRIFNYDSFHVTCQAHFIVCLRPSRLPRPGLGVLLSSYLEGALYKFHR